MTGAQVTDGAAALIAPWQSAAAAVLCQSGVTVAAYVPDKRLDGILRRLAELDVPLRSLSREEECVGYAAGQRMAGKRPVVLMQSSGLGNALNSLAGLAIPYRLGIPLLVSMRGTLGERNPSQVTLGRAVPSLLSAIGIQSFPAATLSSLRQAVAGACTLAYEASECAAVMLEWQLDADS